MIETVTSPRPMSGALQPENVPRPMFNEPLVDCANDDETAMSTSALCDESKWATMGVGKNRRPSRARKSIAVQKPPQSYLTEMTWASVDFALSALMNECNLPLAMRLRAKSTTSPSSSNLPSRASTPAGSRKPAMAKQSGRQRKPSCDDNKPSDLSQRRVASKSPSPYSPRMPKPASLHGENAAVKLARCSTMSAGNSHAFSSHLAECQLKAAGANEQQPTVVAPHPDSDSIQKDGRADNLINTAAAASSQALAITGSIEDSIGIEMEEKEDESIGCASPVDDDDNDGREEEAASTSLLDRSSTAACEELINCVDDQLAAAETSNATINLNTVSVAKEENPTSQQVQQQELIDEEDKPIHESAVVVASGAIQSGSPLIHTHPPVSLSPLVTDAEQPPPLPPVVETTDAIKPEEEGATDEKGGDSTCSIYPSPTSSSPPLLDGSSEVTGTAAAATETTTVATTTAAVATDNSSKQRLSPTTTADVSALSLTAAAVTAVRATTDSPLPHVATNKLHEATDKVEAMASSALHTRMNISTTERLLIQTRTPPTPEADKRHKLEDTTDFVNRVDFIKEMEMEVAKEGNEGPPDLTKSFGGCLLGATHEQKEGKKNPTESTIVASQRRYRERPAPPDSPLGVLVIADVPPISTLDSDIPPTLPFNGQPDCSSAVTSATPSNASDSRIHSVQTTASATSIPPPSISHSDLGCRTDESTMMVTANDILVAAEKRIDQELRLQSSMLTGEAALALEKDPPVSSFDSDNGVRRPPRASVVTRLSPSPKQPSSSTIEPPASVSNLVTTTDHHYQQTVEWTPPSAEPDRNQERQQAEDNEHLREEDACLLPNSQAPRGFPKVGHVEVSVVGSPELFGATAETNPPSLVRRLSNANTIVSPSALAGATASTGPNPEVLTIDSDDERMIERHEMASSTVASVSSDLAPSSLIGGSPSAARSTSSAAIRGSLNGILSMSNQNAGALNSSLSLPTNAEAFQLVQQERIKSSSPTSGVGLNRHQQSSPFVRDLDLFSGHTNGQLQNQSHAALSPSIVLQQRRLSVSSATGQTLPTTSETASPDGKRRGSFTGSSSGIPPKKRFMMSSVESEALLRETVQRELRQEEFGIRWQNSANGKVASDSAIAHSTKALENLHENMATANLMRPRSSDDALQTRQKLADFQHLQKAFGRSLADPAANMSFAQALVRPQATLPPGAFIRPTPPDNSRWGVPRMASSTFTPSQVQLANHMVKQQWQRPVSNQPHPALANKAQLPTALQQTSPQSSMPLTSPMVSTHHSNVVDVMLRAPSLIGDRPPSATAHDLTAVGHAEQLRRAQEIKALPQGDEFQAAINRWDWVLLDGLRMPAVYRGNEKFVAVHIVQMRLLSKFPPNIPGEMMRRFTMVSHKMSLTECWTFNTVNALFCKFEFGCQLFNSQDEVVKLADVERFYWSVKALNLTRMLETYRMEIINTGNLHPNLTATIRQLQTRVELDYGEVQKMMAHASGLSSPQAIPTSNHQQQIDHAAAARNAAIGVPSAAHILSVQQRQQQAVAAAVQHAALAQTFAGAAAAAAQPQPQSAYAASVARTPTGLSSQVIYQQAFEQRQQQRAAAAAAFHYQQQQNGPNGVTDVANRHYMVAGITSGIPPPGGHPHHHPNNAAAVMGFPSPHQHHPNTNNVMAHRSASGHHVYR